MSTRIYVTLLPEDASRRMIRTKIIPTDKSYMELLLTLCGWPGAAHRHPQLSVLFLPVFVTNLNALIIDEDDLDNHGIS